MHYDTPSPPNPASSRDPSEAPLTINVLDRLNQIGDRLLKITGGLHSIQGRLLGSMPQLAASNAGPKAVPNGFVGSFNDQADTISEHLYEIEQLVQTLDQRL